MKKAKAKESITHAAVLGYFKLGKSVAPSVFLGESHHDCFHQAGNTKARTSSKADDQGFVTSKGRYVNRVKAAEIAVRAGQVPKGTKVLCSEDLRVKFYGRFKYDSVKGYHL